MEKFAIFIDAGYLCSQMVQILSQRQSRSRSDLNLTDPKAFMQFLVEKGKAVFPEAQLLRIYWYDAIKNDPTTEHRRLNEIPGVKLRLGHINNRGQQKGVDTKIVIDLIELSSNNAIQNAMIISGDNDIADAIERAQRYGIRVALLGLDAPDLGIHHAQSLENISLADAVIKLNANDIVPFAQYQKYQTEHYFNNEPLNITVPAPQANNDNAYDFDEVSAEDEAIIRNAVDSFVASRPSEEWFHAMPQPGIISREIDKQLVFHTYSTLNRGALSDSQKRLMRNCFREAISVLLQSPAQL